MSRQREQDKDEFYIKYETNIITQNKIGFILVLLNKMNNGSLLQVR